MDGSEGHYVCGYGAVSYQTIEAYPLAMSSRIRIVNGNTIPYLDFAHTTLLPDGMRKHMNRTVMLSLSPIVSYLEPCSSSSR